ncbi:MAG: cysteine--tRNA ligase, partial [Myxococcota bacterium]
MQLYNSISRKKERFEPAHPQVVRMYICGLTVYAPMHIGHARTYAFWDTLKRYLDYLNYSVVSVINYTDIDDRIIASQGEQCLSLVEEMAARFRIDCRSLNIGDYSAYTRATDYIAEQIAMVKELVERGHAYVVEGEVLYDVSSFERYGRLSGKRIEDNEAGASGRLNEAGRRKRHPADFTLWKPSKTGEPSWSTGAPDWPSGRPGWHIECSAMSRAVLGDHFDIHGGAVDNMFPHHENEIAQSEPICGHPWVRYWMHPEHLSLQNEQGEAIKMSKSLGNVISVPELLKDREANAVRWHFAASAHYRTKVAFRWDLLDASEEGFSRIAKLVQVLESKLQPCEAAGGLYRTQREPQAQAPRDREALAQGEFAEHAHRLMSRFREAMDDDLSTPQASAALFDYARDLYAAGIEDNSDQPSLRAAYRCLVRHLHVFGVELAHPEHYPELASLQFRRSGENADDLGPVIQRLANARAQ